ncbi:MAG TPA: alpha/beta hydrolase [Chitinophagaceae bacterium]
MNMNLTDTAVRKSTVISRDTTPIAYEKSGKGPNLILVNGALSYRKSKGVKELVNKLATDFTVTSYDRRGRGESGDTKPYRVEKEIQDIEALIDELGGSAYLFGVSSGAALALLAAKNPGQDKISKLALYEPPFGFASVMGQKEYDDEKKKINEFVNAGKPGDAITVFFQSLGTPPEQIEAMKKSPDWKEMESVGHTLVYDFEILGDGNIPVDLAKNVYVPTLIMDGEKSFDFMHTTADTLVKTIPNAKRKTLKNQTHELSPDVIAPVLKEFFG